MKPFGDRRRPYGHRSPPLPETAATAASGGGAADGALRSPSAVFWITLHATCCLISLVLGFRFSRLVFFLVFSPASTPFHQPSNSVLRHTTTTTTTVTTTTTRTTETLTLSLPTSPPPPSSSATSDANATVDLHGSRVVVGRRGISIRPWPHPDQAEVMRAHWILERVQREQRLQYAGVQRPRPLIVVTPTYARTFQALHLTCLVHTLKLVPYPLTWLVVEAGGVSNETAAILAKSQLQFLHIPFPDKMPAEWSGRRHLVEARMRLRALRVVRERGLDGIVVFADDSNIHSMELFDEVQKVKWMGAVSVGILAHSGSPEKKRNLELGDLERENFPMPIQGPACNSSCDLIGWHTSNSLHYLGNSATFIGEEVTSLPMKLEWAGFVLNSRLLWREAEGKPDWFQDLDSLRENGEEIESPLALLKDASLVEPLGNCGKKVLLWWLRVEARYDSKYPSGWTIEPPLEVTNPAKRILWPDENPEMTSEIVTSNVDNYGIQFSRKSTSSSSFHFSDAQFEP